MSKIIEFKDKNEVEKKQINKVDIAFEVYIAQNYIKKTNTEIWDDNYRAGLPNKGSLEHWLKKIDGEDNNKKSAVTLYLENHENDKFHFNNTNQWNAKKLMEAVQYICRLLVDEEFMSKEILGQYENGFDESLLWRNNVVKIITSYLVKNINSNNQFKLKSDFLTQKLNHIKKIKDLSQKYYENKDKDEEEIITAQLNLAIEEVQFPNIYSDEFSYYQKYKVKIIETIETEKKFLISDQQSLPGMVI